MQLDKAETEQLTCSQLISELGAYSVYSIFMMAH